MQEHSTALARAGKLDAEGRHDDAVNELATAAQRGDVEATTQLAKRIIVGDRAPRLGLRGVGLLQDAVKLGGAEAADRLAVILAAGIAGPPDWPSALRLLVVAAERGWAPARDQLEVLAAASRGDSGTPLPDPSRPPVSILADISLRALLTPEPGQVVREDPRICVFPRFIGRPVCDWLIARARGRLSRALVYDVTTQSDFEGDSRTNSFAVFSLMEADLVHLLVQTRMSFACGQPVSHMEAATVLHYGVGEQIGHHYDFVDPEQPNYAEEIRRFGHRIITFLIYLNSDYDGGETSFPRLSFAHSGSHGEGMFFANTLSDGQADVRTLHSGLPPTRGEKWVFSQFIRNRPESIDGSA
jgi:hypothetical protein